MSISLEEMEQKIWNASGIYEVMLSHDLDPSTYGLENAEGIMIVSDCVRWPFKFKDDSLESTPELATRNGKLGKTLSSR